MNKLATFTVAALLLAQCARLHAAEAAAAAFATRELKLDKQFLLLPIGTAPNPDYHMTITVGGEKIHDFPIDLGVDKVEWWTHIDVSQWAGKIATLTIDKPQETAAGFLRIETADAPRNLHPLYDETMRPQLRFSQQRGWSNDPNGLVYHDGEYHLQVGATKVVYDVEKVILDTMPLPLTDGILRLRVISDRPIYEVWGGKGVVHRSNYRADNGKTISDIRLIAEGGEAVVNSFTVYPMQSI